jgi:CcmD family protein
MKSVISIILLVFAALTGFAQEVEKVEMADAFRSSGKIYVVIAVMSVIFLGIVTYLFYMERRLSKLEKEKK